MGDALECVHQHLLEQIETLETEIARLKAQVAAIDTTLEIIKLETMMEAPTL